VRIRQRDNQPISISDAEPSFDDTQRARKRTYAILMAIHLIGFTLAGVLAHIWWLALGIVAVTGPLPWVAVVIANDRPPRKRQWAQRMPHRPHPAHPAIDQDGHEPRTVHPSERR
jgi:hypothetical protein